MNTQKIQLSKTDCIAILGRRGCGKSYLGLSVIAAYPRVVIFDSLAEYGDEEKDCIVDNYDDFAAAMIDNVEAKKFKIIFRFSLDADESEIKVVSNEVLKLCYHRGSMLIVLEEIQNYQNAAAFGMSPWLKQCLLTGRHRELSVLFTTQRPAELHKTVLSQAHHIFCGQLHEKNDCHYVKSFLRDEHDPLDLENREFIHFIPPKNVQKITNSVEFSL